MIDASFTSPWIIERHAALVRLRLPGASRGHALDDSGLSAILDALRQAELDPTCRMVTLEGSPGTYCLGMDLEALLHDGPSSTFTPRLYAEVLGGLAGSSKVTVAVVDGRALGGGVGLVAACDLAIASPRASFGLPEGLLGLIPSIASAALIRRVGFQVAYRLALTTLPIDAVRAAASQLVDEVDDDPIAAAFRLARRMRQVDPDATIAMKEHFRRVHACPLEAVELSVERLERLMRVPAVRDRVRRAHGRE